MFPKTVVWVLAPPRTEDVSRIGVGSIEACARSKASWGSSGSRVVDDRHRVVASVRGEDRHLHAADRGVRYEDHVGVGGEQEGDVREQGRHELPRLLLRDDEGRAEGETQGRATAERALEGPADVVDLCVRRRLVRRLVEVLVDGVRGQADAEAVVDVVVPAGGERELLAVDGARLVGVEEAVAGREASADPAGDQPVKTRLHGVHGRSEAPLFDQRDGLGVEDRLLGVEIGGAAEVVAQEELGLRVERIGHVQPGVVVPVVDVVRDLSHE
jgi:hypothetical protein